jgi:hypothetical protein
MKFCSRCGFPLGLVSEILSHGGFLPQLAELNKKKSIFTRKNGVVFSLFWFIFFVPFLTSIASGVFGIEILGSIFALTGVFGALMILIASLVFLPSSKQYPLYLPQQMQPPLPNAHGLHGAQPQALPGQQSIPASAYGAPRAGAWRDTNDLEPASVTESTTKLLEKEERPQ